MSRHRLEVREVPGGRAFYIDGSLQFDTRDEAVYHEALALPALALAAARLKGPLEALVLGGGDGLALRRLLSGGGVRRAELVDHDPGVLALARSEFSGYNGGALEDPRVRVRAMDARKYLAAGTGLFGIALADFTFPEDLAGCSLFTRQFFSAVRARLAGGGVFSMNAVSPDRFPAAFWSIYRTLAAARLYPRPLRLSIPSFASHGYGDWGMFLASPRPIKDAELEALRFPGGLSWLSKGTFSSALRLRVSGIQRGLPLSGIIKKPGDLLCLLNLQEHALHGGAMADFSDSAAAKAVLDGIPGAEKLRWPQLSAEWEWRLMETLRLMDWEFFLAELEKSAARLPGKVLGEIRLLRKNLPELLKGAVPDTDRAWQVFALLMTVLVFVNMAYPDNAYAKGGYYGNSGGGDIDVTFFMQNVRSPFHNIVFQGSDIVQTLTASGPPRPARCIRYRAPEAPPGPSGIKEERLYFALTDESFISRTGELFLTPGQTGFLLNARPDGFLLLDRLQPEPLFSFYPEPAQVQAALGSIEQHLKLADRALASYDKWLAWARPAAVFSSEVRENSNEARNIALIRASLVKASQLLQGGKPVTARPEVPAGWFSLGPGFYLADDDELVLINKDGILFSYPYPPARRCRYAVLPRSFELDMFVQSMLRAAWARTSVGDPRKAALETLLASK